VVLRKKCKRTVKGGGRDPADRVRARDGDRGKWDPSFKMKQRGRKKESPNLCSSGEGEGEGRR